MPPERLRRPVDRVGDHRHGLERAAGATPGRHPRPGRPERHDRGPAQPDAADGHGRRPGSRARVHVRRPVRPRRQRSGSGTARRSVRRRSSWTSWCSDSVQGGDFDGDGKFELVCDNGTVLRAGAPNVVPDLMVEAANGIGGRRRRATRRRPTFGCNKPPVRQVVTSIDRPTTAAAGVATTTYTYCDGRTDPAEGAFLGYGQVRATAPCLRGRVRRARTRRPSTRRSCARSGGPRSCAAATARATSCRRRRPSSTPSPARACPRQALVQRGSDDGLRAFRRGDSKTTSVSYDVRRLRRT